MVVAIWLGIYLVSHSPRSPITWLTALTLFSVSGWFLNVLLAINPPPVPIRLPVWLTPFLWIWPAGLFQQGWGGWMQGWQVTPAIMFWHHATMLMRPGRMNAWRWARVLAGYVIAVIAIYVQLNTDLMFTEGQGDPLYLNTLQQGKLYPLFMGFLFIFTLLSLINLLRSAKIAPALMPRRHLNLLAAATLTAGLSGPTALTAFALDIPFPRVVLSIMLGLAVLLMGYGVARYSALIEQRVLGRDFVYNSVAILLVVSLYSAIGWVSVQTYQIPAAALIFIVILAIFTHSLIDIGRQVLDFVFFRREARELRTKLRALMARAGEPQALQENLSLTLKALCDSVRATFGLILTFEKDNPTQVVSYKWNWGPVRFPISLFTFDDVVQFNHGDLADPLAEAALAIPLYSGGKQQGVLILGQPANGVRYSASDIEHLLDVSDRISDVMHTIQRETEYLSRLTELAQVQQLLPAANAERIAPSVVEDCLRNLHDLALLGNSPLAQLELVKSRLSPGETTHLDRGKQVHQVLLSALEKLRPSSDLPREPIPREWHSYLILSEAYLKNIANRDIMSQLYISEGTFNRARRAAIRSLARALSEMENSM
jgi:hypothetical protein